MVQCVARIFAETFFKAFECFGEVVAVDDVGKAHFVAAETWRGVESGGGCHHHGLILIPECFEHPAAEHVGIVDGQFCHWA